MAADDPDSLHAFADQVAPVYRRRRVSMDDLIRLAEGSGAAPPGRARSATSWRRRTPRSTQAIEVFRWHRRLAGDARKRNRLLQAIYKGA